MNTDAPYVQSPLHAPMLLLLDEGDAFWLENDGGDDFSALSERYRLAEKDKACIHFEAVWSHPA